MQAVLDAIDGDVGAGTLEIGTTGMAAVLATLTLVDPAGSVSGDVLTLDCDPVLSTTATGTGTAAEARIKDNSGDVIISGLTVSTSGANINLTSTSIATDQTVEISSIAITHNTSG